MGRRPVPRSGRSRRRADAAPSRSCAPLDGAVAIANDVDLADELAVPQLARGRLPGSVRGVGAHRHPDRSRRSAPPRRHPATPPDNGSPSPARVALLREIDGGVLQDRGRSSQLRVPLTQRGKVVGAPRAGAKTRSEDRQRQPCRKNRVCEPSAIARAHSTGDPEFVSLSNGN